MTDEPAPGKRFAVDVMLGKLAKWLRVLGFDTIYLRLRDREQLESLKEEGFIPVSRHSLWCGHTGVLCPDSDDPMEQLRQVVLQAGITREEVRLLHRCTLCNVELQRIERDKAFGFVPDYIFETGARFFRCPKCRRIYWPGTHSTRMMERLDRVLGWSVGN